jgi:hypothetical protein
MTAPFFFSALFNLQESCRLSNLATGEPHRPEFQTWSGESMAVLKRRSRTISIRLSEEEFLALRRVRLLTGARSVSELTREAIRPVLGEINGEDPLGLRLEEFRTYMKSLERKLEQLEEKITNFKSEAGQ